MPFMAWADEDTEWRKLDAARPMTEQEKQVASEDDERESNDTER